MATVDEVLSQVSELLTRLNSSEKKGNRLGVFLRNPIVITVVGSILVAGGSNWVTKEFQLRDKQSDALAAMESEIPRELALTTHLAMVSSILEQENCSETPDKKLTNPLVVGLSGKSCKEAETEYMKYYTIFLEHPAGASLARIRALFASPAVGEGARKLGALVGLLSVTSQDTCIVEVAQRADEAYDQLLDLSIQEIEGHTVNQTPDVFKLTDLPSHCKLEELCRVPALSRDSSLKLKCG